MLSLRYSSCSFECTASAFFIWFISVHHPYVGSVLLLVVPVRGQTVVTIQDQAMT